MMTASSGLLHRVRHLRTKGILLAMLTLGSITAGFALSSTASAAKTTHAPQTYTVGLDYNASGVLAPYAVGIQSFYQAWISYANSTGGVQGHKINVLVLDDKGDAGQTLLNYETMWGQDHVLAVIGGGTYTPWAYIKANSVVVLATSGGAGSRGFASYYQYWFTTGSLSPTWNSQAAYLSVKGAPNTSQIGEAELLGRTLVGVIAGSPTQLSNQIFPNG